MTPGGQEPPFRGVRAVIFDMDGTLIDSEALTEQSIRHVLRAAGIESPSFDYRTFHGITWSRIAAKLVDRYAELRADVLISELADVFWTLGQKSSPPPIPMAREAVVRASARVPTAIATSSVRASVEDVLDRLDLRGVFTDIVCAEDYERSKPDPQCYLLAAERLSVPPRDCLVFEDSDPGMQAARAAGMKVIAITHGSTDTTAATRIADLAIPDYSQLDPGFFAAITR